VKAVQGLDDAGLEKDQAVLGLLDLSEELVDLADLQVTVADREGVHHERLIRAVIGGFLPVWLPDNGQALRVLQVHNSSSHSHRLVLEGVRLNAMRNLT